MKVRWYHRLLHRFGFFWLVGDGDQVRCAVCGRRGYYNLFIGWYEDEWSSK